MARPRPNQEAIATFMSITGVSEAIAVQKLQEHSGDVNDALEEHFNEGARNVARNHSASSIHDSIVPRNRFDALSDPTNQSDGRDDTDDQMMRAASESSIQAYERFSISQEERDIDRAISLSIVTAEQERAQRLQGDVRAPIVGPPDSSLGKIAASDGRFQAGTSSVKDEGEDAREQPLIQKRSRPISLASTELAENADVIRTSTMSSSGNRDTYSNRQHNRNAIHEEEELERQLAVKKAYLPPEPSVHDENAVTLQIKMPDGNHLGRRFLTSDNLQYLFDVIDISRVVKSGTYKLVRQDPRCTFSDVEGTLTLNEVGLTKKHEVLYLELI